MGSYKFNKEQLKFIEDKIGVKGWIKKIFKYFFVSILLSILYYLIVSTFFKTELEKKLILETEIMNREYEKLQSMSGVLDNTLKSLQQRDREIYREIFKSEPPTIIDNRAKGKILYEELDTLQNSAIVSQSCNWIADLESSAQEVKEIISYLEKEIVDNKKDLSRIPIVVPVKDFTIRQTGASIGNKVNPFHKSVQQHNGLDLLAANGTYVIASGAGVVEQVVRLGRKDGNSITINHNNGYITKYNNLGTILTRKGAKVKQGDIIGKVGISGMSFAPHLHFEVWYNNKIVDPVNMFFSNITPAQYTEMVMISRNTGQSLD